MADTRTLSMLKPRPLIQCVTHFTKKPLRLSDPLQVPIICKKKVLDNKNIIGNQTLPNAVHSGSEK